MREEDLRREAESARVRAQATAEYRRQAQRRSAAEQHRNSELKRLSEEAGLSLTYAQSMSPYEFENFVARLFELDGYRVVQTPYSNDGGFDLIALKGDHKLLIECKRYGDATRVGRPSIQILYAAMMHERATGAAFVSTSGYTRQAREFARGKPIRLIDGSELSAVVAAAGSDPASGLAYTLRCAECGTTVQCRIGSAGPLHCSNGHEIERITRAQVRNAVLQRSSR